METTAPRRLSIVSRQGYSHNKRKPELCYNGLVRAARWAQFCKLRSEIQMTLFCKHCGIELDSDDVEMNVAYWGIFRMCCQNECWEYEDNQVEKGN